MVLILFTGILYNISYLSIPIWQCIKIDTILGILQKIFLKRSSFPTSKLLLIKFYNKVGNVCFNICSPDFAEKM